MKENDEKLGNSNDNYAKGQEVKMHDSLLETSWTIVQAIILLLNFTYQRYINIILILLKSIKYNFHITKKVQRKYFCYN